MTAWVDALKENSIPEYAKDTKLNIDAVVKRGTLPVEEAEAVALAAAFATGNSKLWTWMESQITNKTETTAALTAAALMSQNNVWYPFVEMADDDAAKAAIAALHDQEISGRKIVVNESTPRPEGERRSGGGGWSSEPSSGRQWLALAGCVPSPPE